MDEARTVTAADGVRLAYWLRTEDGEGRRLALFLHGAASNHTRWSELVETTRLRRTWDLLRPDLRGNAESMTRGRQGLEVWRQDLEEILDAEGGRPALVVGHSLGAQIAIRLAYRSPERVRGLVLIDPVLRRALTGGRRLLSRCAPLLRAVVGVVRLLNRLGLRRSQLPLSDLRRLDEETREALRGPDAFEVIAERYSSLPLILRHTPTANYLRQLLATVAPLPPLEGIAVPVLALLSAGITFADLDVQRAGIGALPDVEIHTLTANHWPLTETPDEVRQAIEGWVDRTLPHR